MTHIDLRGIELTIEMKQWINKEALYYKWQLGDKLPRNGRWKQSRERIGVIMYSEDALVFKLKFGI